MHSPKYIVLLCGILLLTVCALPQWCNAENCLCSNLTCTTNRPQKDECCIWDFPLPDTNNRPLGFVLSDVPAVGKSTCVTYPIPDDHVDSNNYFLISLETTNPVNMCIYANGDMENEKCSSQYVHFCMSQPVTGVSQTTFSFICKDCEFEPNEEVLFFFKVYSKQYNTTVANWCDKIPTPIPSDLVNMYVPNPTAGVTNGDSGSGQRNEALTPSPIPSSKLPQSSQPSNINMPPTAEHTNAAPSSIHHVPSWIILTCSLLMLLFVRY